MYFRSLALGEDAFLVGKQVTRWAIKNISFVAFPSADALKGLIVLSY